MAESSDGDCFNNLHQSLNSMKLDPNADDDADTTSDTEWRSARLSSSDDNSSSFNDALRVQQLEEEQERLNNSLFSLSSHFAQVQFRLKQISEAKGEDREALLKDLQDFAFKGCADMNELKRLRSESEGGEVLEIQKERQNELLKQLREQLEDLEKIAYENGEGDMPSTLILQKQKAVLDELHEKMSLNLELDKMSVAEIQKHVDSALKQLVNPFKEKQQLVEQLQTQIVDLERFVSYLQKENSSQETSPARFIASKPKSSSFFGLVGGSANRFQKNQLKNTLRGNHYGDERARLQLAVDATQRVLEKYTLLSIEGTSAKSELQEVEVLNDILLTTIENIVSSHARLRRSKDAQWKAFVSAAMNEKKLPAWLRIIFRTRYVVEMCYNSWSYVARTGCEELYTLLEGLHKYNVELPVDLALRPFQQMKDAF
ncbi:hypothetical protein ANCCEY_00086 [Ancylostoma ceylanicum]|uniref:RUN domain-containing protein n=1 Tax=Ancylostoma ceylanicum TaxID=53326 RepID=A0A0D6M9R1_9BILA|nr:hypothetical protein ANCCEY_00086 [Ancylostoma ceylanicum]